MGKITGFLEIDRRDRKYAPAADRIRHYHEFVIPLSEEATRDQAARSHDQIAKGLMKPWPGKAYSSVFGSDHEYFFVEFVKRLDHGNYVEHHTHWIDQTTILSGEGILTYGGTIADPEKIAPGEVWGHKQVGGKTIHLRPGDFVLIPTNTPHHFDALPGTELNYVVYKHRV